ncbi:MAG TPA: hypothetical protein VK771_10715 [Acidimicrobiia bacterium]|jgi:hypothetical protein|nr:hypothetical protein [Acidimicrobiia bacterium]
MDEEYRTLLLDAYKGELFGEALFEAFAAHESDHDRVTKLRALERIEGATALQLRRLVDAAGIAVDDADVEAVADQGREIGRAGLEWDAFVKGLHDALPAYLANFVRLRTVATDSNDPSLVALVAHELAINAFAELELSGRGDCSIAVLHWHLESVA